MPESILVKIHMYFSVKLAHMLAVENSTFEA